MSRLVSLADVRRAADRALPRLVRDFLNGGADDEVTLRRNLAAFDDYALVPRYLVDVTTTSSAVTVLGQRLSMPVLLGPSGLARFAHPDGELAVARAAAEAGTAYVASIAGSTSLEQIAEAAAGPRWFQLYLWRGADLVRSVLDRADRAGYDALVLTVDVPMSGHRERDLRNGLSIPPRFRAGGILDVARHPRWLLRYLRSGALTYANLVTEGVPDGGAFALADYVNTTLTDRSVTWEAVAELRRHWSKPLVVKGILSPDDARAAVRAGADAIIVSNHGGRQLDHAVASLHALPRVVDAVGDSVQVLVDGGVRRGTDVLKALALGATACLIARPYWHGLAVDGEAGVSTVLRLLREELERAQVLMGLPALDHIPRNPEWLVHAVQPSRSVPDDRIT